MKPGLGSLKVMENDTIRSCTHDLLLTLIVTIGVSGTVSEIMAISLENLRFLHTPRVFIAPTEAVLLGIGCQRKGLKTLK